MLPNSGSVAQESNTERQVLGKRKDSFTRKPAVLGRRWTHVPKNQLSTPRVLLGDFIGKRGGEGCRVYGQLKDLLLTGGC